MVKFILLFLMLVSGCASKHYYPRNIDDIINKMGTTQISDGPKLMKTPENNGTVIPNSNIIVRTVTPEETRNTLKFPSIYPYSIGAAIKEKNIYRFSVTEDSSGIYWQKKDLKIWKKGNYLYINAPNKTIKNYILGIYYQLAK